MAAADEVAALRERVAALELELSRAERTKEVLMDRVEASLASETASFGLFERTVVLERVVVERTRELDALNQTLLRQKDELEEALARVRGLEGIIPVCMHCHRIREGEADWQRFEAYLSAHSDAHFSHGICPSCFRERYDDSAKLEPET